MRLGDSGYEKFKQPELKSYLRTDHPQNICEESLQLLFFSHRCSVVTIIICKIMVIIACSLMYMQV